jgi:hypothetical protein
MYRIAAGTGASCGNQVFSNPASHSPDFHPVHPVHPVNKARTESTDVQDCWKSCLNSDTRLVGALDSVAVRFDR